jgi:N-hydroxyarylamine O-acetyltransferase
LGLASSETTFVSRTITLRDRERVASNAVNADKAKSCIKVRMTLLDRYLERLGLQGPVSSDLETLRRLHAAHVERVPFENLSIALEEPISLERDGLAHKILDLNRGGFCYELNGLFADLLRAIGYEVTLLGARVWGEHGYGPPLDHLALLVGCSDGSEWIADVGFGAHSRYPLGVHVDADQPDPDGIFRIEESPADITVVKDGAVQYRIERYPRALADFAAMCWFQQHSPASHFTNNVICSRATAHGRVSLREDVLIVTDRGTKRERPLADDTAILTAYREHFGIELDRVPRLKGIPTAVAH